MLVLNTNDSGADMLVNKYYGQYPDVNQILIAPAIQSATIPYGNGSGYEAVRYVLPGFFMGGSSNQEYGLTKQIRLSVPMGTSAGISTGNVPIDINVGSPVVKIFLNSEFSGGEVVGKRIIGKHIIGYTRRINRTSGTANNQLMGTDMNLKLIESFYLGHTDGTKTLINTIDSQIAGLNGLVWYINTSSYYSAAYGYHGNRIIDLSGNGIVAQKGDVLFIELQAHTTGTITNSNNTTLSSGQIYTSVGLLYGSLGGIRGAVSAPTQASMTSRTESASNFGQPRPYQISVD